MRNIIIRILARAVDFVLYTGLFVAVWSLAGADFEMLGGSMAAVVIALSWALLEILLLVIFGSTPGKALLDIKLTQDGQSLTRLDKVRRTIGWLVIGNGFGVPYVVVAAWIINLVMLITSGRTLYDKITSYSVEVGQVGKLRVVLIVGALVVVAAIVILAQADGTMPVIYYKS